MFTRSEKQYLIEPLVIGWGWGEDREVTFGSDYLDYMQWLGTNDLAAYLAVPTAIEFHEIPKGLFNNNLLTDISHCSRELPHFQF